MNIGICPICAKHITDEEEWEAVEIIKGWFAIPAIVHKSHFTEPGWNWYGGFGKSSPTASENPIELS